MLPPEASRYLMLSMQSKRTQTYWLALAAALWASPAFSDDSYYRAGGKEYKERFHSGRCQVEREGKHNGDFKEERKCKGGPRGYGQKEKVRDGPCLIEREWKSDGEYVKKVECK
ncbi:hypothetical protein AEMCBJ_34240 (plasmid) [Cupriavidus necator]|uniref:Uncharacterized protein n=2 Tax=Burkholderiaceae TaxID=119060 RepID=A0A7Z7JIG8_9BURK|nr:conserved exported hypothetical protein [Cupriavidus taiwanensis]SOZ96988.1 conserved exported hypothetical protein [Cupriavidus taiwanensis]SPC25935.1 conserved exported hypothetical protein [Cupriavidus taiwanensis]SPD38039.1 conserved exported protein of unknown function [Cupriavidus taiwanensis]